MAVFLFNTIIYVLLLLCLCILIVCLCIFILPAGTLRLPWLRFFRLFSSVVSKCQGKTRKNRARLALFQTFCVLLCIVCLVSFYPLCVCVCVCVCVLCVCVCVCKCVLYYCHRVATQLRLTNISSSFPSFLPFVPSSPSLLPPAPLSPP